MKFDSYHPTVNLIYFIAVIGYAIWFNHPVFLAISYITAFAYSVKLNGVRGFVFDLCLIPFVLAWTAWYAFYTHFGVTELGVNFAGNTITLESAVYGLVIGATVATVFMWMSCVFAIFSSDKIVYLFGRISPKLSLSLSIILRSVPLIKRTARKINIGRKGIGLGCGQGNIIAHVRNTVGLFSVMVTWTLESFTMRSKSMQNRGYLLKGRTAFSIYRFDNRDRSLVVVMFLCFTLIAMAIMLNQVTIIYNPEIIMNRVTVVSYVFYLAYGFLLLLPMMLQIAGEARLKQCMTHEATMTKHQDNATIPLGT